MYANFRYFYVASGESGSWPTRRMFVQRLRQLPEVRSFISDGVIALDKVTTKNGKSGRYVVGLRLVDDGDDTGGWIQRRA